MTPRDNRDEVIRAAILADWQQVALNGGPPCFHVCEDGHFCFRAKRWAGHDDGQIHAFVSLEALLRWRDGAGVLATLQERRGRRSLRRGMDG